AVDRLMLVASEAVVGIDEPESEFTVQGQSPQVRVVGSHRKVGKVLLGVQERPRRVDGPQSVGLAGKCANRVSVAQEEAWIWGNPLRDVELASSDDRRGRGEPP